MLLRNAALNFCSPMLCVSVRNLLLSATRYCMMLLGKPCRKQETEGAFTTSQKHAAPRVDGSHADL